MTKLATANAGSDAGSDAASAAGSKTGGDGKAGNGKAGAGAAEAASGTGNRILVVGDSLSAEYGLKRGSGWVGLLEERLQRDQVGFANLPGAATVINASISGETTAGGWTRFPGLVERHQPAIAIIALGSNDALRGLDLSSTERNLGMMIDTAQEAGAQPLLVGMILPPNYGKAYATRFASVYAGLAKRHQIPLVPFLMAGFAEDLGFFQADRIHPNERAQPLMLDNVWPELLKLATASAKG